MLVLRLLLAQGLTLHTLTPTPTTRRAALLNPKSKTLNPFSLSLFHGHLLIGMRPQLNQRRQLIAMLGAHTSIFYIGVWGLGLGCM